MIYTTIPQYLAATLEPVKYVLLARAMIGGDASAAASFASMLGVDAPKSAAEAWRLFTEAEKQVAADAEDTETAGFLPPTPRVVEAFRLNAFEGFVMSVALAVEINPVFAAVSSGIHERMTLGLLLRLYAASAEESIGWQAEWLRRQDKLRLVFNGTDLRDTISLRSVVLRFLLGLDALPNGTLMSAPDAEPVTPVHEAFGAFEQVRDGGVVCVYGELGSGRTELIRDYANFSHKPAIFLPYMRLGSVDRDDIAACAALYGAYVCVTNAPTVLTDELFRLADALRDSTMFVTSDGAAAYADVNVAVGAETVAVDGEFWTAVDTLIAASNIVIDRPKGSNHPRYGDYVYEFDYGYLENTSSADGNSIDVWVGSLGGTHCDAVMCTVDLVKRDSEIKLLIGCTGEESEIIAKSTNENFKKLLIRR